MVSIEINDICKTVGDKKILDHASFYINSGELIGLLGASGSGKTTLLRIISGLTTANSGKIIIGNVDATSMTVQQRRIGYVFQHYALFKHMNVFENIAFGMRIKPRALRLTNQAICERVTSLLQFVRLEDVADLYPGHLSG